jgi:hypothetical protein
MSDTRVKDSPHLEQLKAQLLDRVGHDSSADTLEDFVADVERISRFVIVPPEFMEMLRDIASSSERYGAGSLQTSLKIQEADPEWADLIADLDELVDFEDLKVELTEFVSYPFKSRTFPTLLKELKRIRRAARIPDEFIDKLGEIVERHEARETGERVREAEVAKIAHLEGADPDFTKDLVAFARSVGLDVGESRDVMDLMARLRKLANVHINVRHKLKPFEAELRGEGPKPDETTTAVSDVVEGDDEEEPASRGEEQDEEKAEPIPLHVTTYNSMKGIDWGDGERTGSIGLNDDALMMSAYGYAIFGTNRTVNFGIPADPGMSAFLLSDPVSGLVSVGKFPYISSMEGALARIAETCRITARDLERDPDSISPPARRSERYRTIEEFRSAPSPHWIELRRIGRQIGKLEISVEGFAAGAAFFSGRPGEKEFGAPPAQVITMLGAIRSVGIESVNMGMFFYPERGSSELLYDADDGILRVGRRKLLALGGGGAVDVNEILSLESDIVRELEGLTADGKFVETIRTYHLPLAMGLWRDSLALLRRKVMGVIKTASKKEGGVREKYLLSTYLKWHSMLPRNLNGRKSGGKARSGKGGGGKSFRGIVRNRAPSRMETPEAIMELHHEGDGAEAAIISGAALSTGILPIVAHAGAVVI